VRWKSLDRVFVTLCACACVTGNRCDHESNEWCAVEGWRSSPATNGQTARQTREEESSTESRAGRSRCVMSWSNCAPTAVRNCIITACQPHNLFAYRNPEHAVARFGYNSSNSSWDIAKMTSYNVSSGTSNLRQRDFLDLFRRAMTLTIDLLTPKVDHSMLLPRASLCQFESKSAYSISKRIHKSAIARRDGRKNSQAENVVAADSLDRRRHEKVIDTFYSPQRINKRKEK